MATKDIYKKLDEINVVTPGLFNKFFEFISHLKVSGNDPILITGPTGVGKSLFINIVKKNLDNVDNFIMVNCAHFDPELAESVLFGHIKGAYSGATGDKIGLLKQADGRTLVLDEIGELPKKVQAKLLMFLETGVFFKLGREKPEHAEVRIVGATSRKNKLRKDFFHRFFEFSIPPLHKRRMDVLYYIAMKYPGHIEMLTPSDILILLSNNWHGNLREINNVVSTIQKREGERELREQFYFAYLRENPVSEQKGKFFEKYGLDGNSGLLYKVKSLYDSLTKNKIDEKRFEVFLNQFGIGLDPNNSKKVFENFINKELKAKNKEIDKYLITPSLIKCDMKIPEKYGVKLIVQSGPFYKIEEGFAIFCSLFFQDPCEDKNILEASEGFSVDFPQLNYPIIDFHGKKIRPEVINAWSNKVFECLSGIQLSGDVNLMTTNNQRVSILSKILLKNPENRFLNSLAKKRLIDVPIEYSEESEDYWSWDYEEFQEYYLRTLVEKHDWNVTKAAKSVTLKTNTLWSKLRRFGIEKQAKE